MKEIIWSGASPVLMPREDPAGKIVFAIVLFVIVLVWFVALITFLAAVLRSLTERGKEAIAWSPGRTALAGIAAYVVFGGLAAWLYSMAFIRRLLETEIVWGFLVAAIVVTGSVARGAADESSDIDMLVFLHEKCSQEEFQAECERANTTGGRLYGGSPDEGFALFHFVDGVRFDVVFDLVSTMEKRIEQVMMPLGRKK